jgi:hypothetical protein
MYFYIKLYNLISEVKKKKCMLYGVVCMINANEMCMYKIILASLISTIKIITKDYNIHFILFFYLEHRLYDKIDLAKKKKTFFI